MTQNELLFPVTMVIAGLMALVILYFALRGGPGVVSMSPPAGSPRWPVYAFFIAWFIAGFTAPNQSDGSKTWLYVRGVMFVIVLVSFLISTRRLKQNPVPPPRV